jgi:uncharacterized protein YjcR
MRRKYISLSNFIEEFGRIELAKKVGVTVRTVDHWKNRYCWPRPKQMIALKKLSRGTLTYEEMIDNNGPISKGRR